jgi:hypothetical protein
MWSIVTALIYYLIFVPGWKLTSRDVAKVRDAGSHKNLRRAA